MQPLFDPAKKGNNLENVLVILDIQIIPREWQQQLSAIVFLLT